MDLRAVLVDDEQLARDELVYLVSQVGGVELIGQAGDGVEALETIRRLQPDLVFLDVQMPGLTGFEVAKRLVEDGSSSHIVFVTAFDQYAIEAFEVNAVDYLLKPVDPGRLEIALDRARRRVALERQADRESPAAGLLEAGITADQLERIVQLVADRQTRRERLALKVGERLLLVQADEVIFASMADESIIVVTHAPRGHVQLPQPGRTAGAARSERLLARPSLPSGEHQQDQGDRPLVQSELYPQDERREDHGDSGQPHPDQASARLSEALTSNESLYAVSIRDDQPGVS